MNTQNARYKLHFIFGTAHVEIYDTKLNRAMTIDTAEVVTAVNVGQIFVEMVEAMRRSENIKEGEAAVCVTYPEGCTLIRPGGRA